VRYTRQYRKSNCGPVAIINIFRHFGVHITFKQYSKTFTKLGHRATKGGTWPTNLERMFRYFGIKFRKITNIIVRDIESALDRNQVVVLNFTWWNRNNRKKGGHYCLIVGHTEKYFYVVNDRREGKALQRLPKDTYRKDFTWTRMKGENPPALWVVMPR